MGWLRRLFRTNAEKDKLYQDIDRELTFHIDELTRENVAAGMEPEEERRQARIAFGGERQIAEESRRSRGVPWLDDFVHDVRFGSRMLLKTPGYTLAAILALSVGIGPNTAFFTLFDAMFLKPVPVPLDDEVVVVERTMPGARFPIEMRLPLSEYQYYREHSTMLEDLSANTASLQGAVLMNAVPGDEEPVSGLFVSSNYFSVVRLDPVLGDRFTAEDDLQTAPPYRAMLSENFWERRFGRDPQILGRNLTIGGVPTVIVGITPRDFMGARPGVPDFWLPLGILEDAMFSRQDAAACCNLEGRLQPGVSRQQAEAELTQLAYAFHADSLDADPEWKMSLSAPTPGFLRNSTLFREPTRRLVLFSMFQAAVGMVLLIACANVAGLLIGKSIARQKEIALRLSLGASRGRLVRQLLTEAMLIAQIAGVLSLLMSWWVVRILVQMAASALSDIGGGSFLLDLTPDLRIFLYTFGIASVTAIAFSLSPALQTTRVDLTRSLNGASPARSGGRRSDFRGNVSAQIAACLMLLIAAGTIVASSKPLLTSDLGFDPDPLLAISVSDPEQSRDLQAQLADMPGIASIASASGMPISRAGFLSATIEPLVATGRRAEEQVRAPRYPLTFVSSGYFDTLGIARLQGRTFTPEEIATRAPVAVVSNSLAERLWPGESAIGKGIAVGDPARSSFDVIGVVRDVSARALRTSYPGALYLPSNNDGQDNHLLIRAATDRGDLLAHLSRELGADAGLPVNVRTMASVMTEDPGFLLIGIGGTVFSILGLLGLLLASVGTYSMVAYAVSRQTGEIGIRMALGAQRSDVRRMIVRRSMRPIAEGVAAGIVLGTIVSLVLSRGFPEVRLPDPWILAAISVTIAVIALGAAYVPARKATNLDPSTTLRGQ